MTKNEKLDKAIHYLKGGRLDVSAEEIITDLESLKSKPRVEKPKKEYSQEVLTCFSNCLKFFPYYLYPKDPKKWCEIIDQLHRIDEVEFNEIERVVAAVRADSFWGKNFQSIAKLRKLNRDLVQYFISFQDRFPIQNKTSHHRNFAPDSTFN